MWAGKWRWAGGCMAAALLLALACPPGARAQEKKFYARSYALVIGIDKYPARGWPDLPYAKKDARGVAAFLREEGFGVETLYDGQATKIRIKSELLKIARRLRKDDRVVVFFSGHGHTETFAGQDFGYLVPHDGGEDSATYISMEELRELSRKLGAAKHQLFILDACFGGLIGVTKSSTAYERHPWPNYVGFITGNSARQFLSAGGKDQRVRAGGPKGYSFFTGYLLEALGEGRADLYPDGYITFAELASYLIPRATNPDQTPVAGVLPQHGQGQFVFRSPLGSLLGPQAGREAAAAGGPFKSRSPAGERGAPAPRETPRAAPGVRTAKATPPEAADGAPRVLIPAVFLAANEAEVVEREKLNAPRRLFAKRWSGGGVEVLSRPPKGEEVSSDIGRYTGEDYERAFRLGREAGADFVLLLVYHFKDFTADRRDAFFDQPYLEAHLLDVRRRKAEHLRVDAGTFFPGEGMEEAAGRLFDKLRASLAGKPSFAGLVR